MSNQHIVDCAMRALLYEVSATPKPGLVDRQNNGAHHDMNFFSFIDSSVSLNSYFNKIRNYIELTYGNHAPSFLPADAIFKSLVPLGIEAEVKMKAVTNGVNTHKGAIYALGLLTAAALENSMLLKKYDISHILDRVSEYVAPSLSTVFMAAESDESYGVQQYRTLGLLGARGEAFSKYASVTEFGLPSLELALEKGCNFNDAMIHALLNLMAHVVDSNVIGRHDLDMLSRSQSRAKEVLDKGSVFSDMGKMAINAYDEWCNKAYVSHGGCADLLAVTLFLYFIKETTIL